MIEFAKNLSILPKNVCQVRFLFQFCGCFDVLLDFLLQEFLWFRKQLFYSNFIASLQRTNWETVHNLVVNLNVCHRKQLKSWFRNIMAIHNFLYFVTSLIIRSESLLDYIKNTLRVFILPSVIRTFWKVRSSQSFLKENFSLLQSHL